MATNYLKTELYELIKQDERIFDFIQEGSLDGLWYWDLENPENEWMSPRFWEILGYDPKEMPHKASAWQDIINPDDLKAAIENVNKHVANPHHPYDQEVRYTHKNGSTIWIRCRGLAIRDNEGKAIRMIGAHQDISALKNKKLEIQQEHDKVKKNEEMYRFMAENAADVIRYQLPSGEFSYISPNIKELTGYTAEEYMKFDPLENVYVKDHPVLKETVNKIQAGEDFVKVEYRIHHKNGEIIWLQSRIKVIRDEQGNATSLLSASNNITASKLLQLALAESEEKYKAMYNNAPLAFQSLDIEGNIIEVNPQWLSILEYDKDEVIGRWFGDFLHPDFVEHFRTNFPRFKKQGYINDVQFRMKKKSGAYVYVSFEGCIGYTPEGQFKQTYCTFKDITKEKAAEQQLIESEEKYRRLAKETATNLNNLKAATNITTIFLDTNLAVFDFSPGDHMEGHLEKDNNLSLKEIASHYKIKEIDKLCEKVLNSLVAIELEVTCTHDMVWWMRISPYKTLEGKIEGLVITFTNITEKKKQEAELDKYRNQLEELVEQKNRELVESEKRLKEAQEIAAIGNYEHNIETEEKWWSEELYHILEFDVNEAPPSIEEFSKRLDDENIENLNRHMQKAISSGKMETLTYKIYMPSSDTYKYISSKVEFYIHEHSGERYLRGTLQDVTERIERENELRHQKDLFERVINSVPSFIFWKDKDLNYLGCNTTFAQFAGLEKASDIIGKSDYEMVWKAEAKKFRADDQQVIDKKTEKRDYDENVIDPSGNRHLLHTHKMPLTDSAGATIGMIATCEDITERKAAEKQIKESEEKFRELYNQSPIAIQYYDAEGNLLDVNKSTLNLYGIDSIDEIAPYNFWHSNKLSDENIKDLNNGKPIFINEIFDFEAIKKQGYFKTEKTGILFVELLVAPIIRNNKTDAYLVHMTDVTEKILATDKLKASEGKFRAVFEDTNIGMALGSPDGNVLEVNDEYLNILGYTRDEFINLNYASITHPDDLAKELPLFEQLHKGEIDHYRLEKRLLAKNGEYRWLDAAISSRRDKDGKIDLTIALVIDIHEGKRANEIVNVFFEQPMNIHLIATIQGGITKINEGWVQTLGYTKEETIGKNIMDFIHPDDKENTLEELKDLESGKKTFYFENRYQHKNGHYISLAWSAIYNTSGKLLHAIAKDITQQKDYQKKLQNIIDHSTNLFFSHSIDHEISYISPQVKDFLGYEAEEVIQNWTDFITDNPINNLAVEYTMKAIETGRRQPTYEMEMLRKDGKKIIVEVREAPVVENGKVISMVGSLVDITKRKNFQEALLKSEENYKTLAENAKHLIIRHQPDGEITYANKFAINYLKIPKEKLIGLDIKTLIGNEAKAEHHQQISSFQENANTNYRHHFEIELESNTESSRYLDVMASPILSAKNLDSILITAYDITERKYAENRIKEQNEEYEALNEELRQTNDELFTSIEREQTINERFHKAMEATSDGLWDRNLVTKEIYYSPRWKAMLGYSDEELPNDISVWHALTEAADLEKSSKMLNQLINGDIDKYDIELKMKHKDGHWVDINSRANVFKDKDGKAIRVVGTHSDITERKLTENKLRESEEKLRLAIDNSPLGITIYNTQGRFVSVNKAYEELVGYQKDELSTMSFFDITHPDYRPKNQELFDAMVQNEDRGFSMNKKYTHKNGKLLDVRVHAGSIKDHNGKAVFGMAFIEDITERVALERQAKMLSTAVESSPVCIVITDVKGNIEYVNPFFTDMTGYTSEEVMGKNPSILKSGLQTREFYADLWKSILSGKTWNGEFHNKKKNGELFWENAAISPIFNEKEEIIQFIAVKEDITQLKHYLAELKEAKEKAEEANALKTEFLHNMSHEIRTPMNGIMGFANILGELDSMSDIQKNYTRIIQNSSMQLLNVIDDILEISTLETKQLSTQEKEFDVNQFMTELFAIYDLKSKERNLPLYLKKGLSNEQSYIVSDKAKLHKILSNLIDNAFKFTSTGKIEFGYYIKGANIVFFVSDTGIGISKDKQERVFHRFSQESSETAQEYGGLGLGLSIAKENSELLGGHISLESEKGKGTSFFIEIPFKSKHNIEIQESMTKEELKMDKELTQILITEDEEVNFLYLEAILEEYNNKNVVLHHAINGQQAIDICSENEHIDIILMDIKMPVMNGYIAAEKIKAEKPDLPIIAQTAYSTSAERDLALSHGCDDFISKPIDKNKLLEMLNKYLF